MEIDKIFFWDLALSAAAYFGRAKGIEKAADAAADAEIAPLVKGALLEAAEGHKRSTGEDVEAEALEAIDSLASAEDTTTGASKAPAGKLSRDGALGTAVFTARNSGVYPYYIEKAMAYALMCEDADEKLAKDIRLAGVKEALKNASGITEPDVLYGVVEHYKKADGGFVAEDADEVDFIAKAYDLGFKSELKYRGCGQCAIAALDELLGERHDDIFKCATGFSGGMALCGDGVCGGYAGGMMIMSFLRGRAFGPMNENGDKINQYAAYETSQMLHDRYVDCYGSPVCMRIHEGMFGGEYYILRTKARRNEFEDAGAHTFVCTTVVALSCAWTAEIMLKKRLVKLPLR